MKILMLGNPYMAGALRKRGHAVLAANWHGSGQMLLGHPATAKNIWQKAHAAGFEPDLLLYQDDGNLPVLLDPENVPCPAIYYSIDTYCNPWHVGYAHGFDVILVAQKDFLSLFTREGMDARWFPLFNPREENYALDGGQRDVPIAFVGSLGHQNNPEREPFLKRFRRLQPLVMRQGAYAELFSRSLIVLNQTAFSEINFRCFEAMACGAALLTEQCSNGFEELFTPGENILPPYKRNDARAAADIACRYLARPQALAEIAKAGQEHVRLRHGPQARAATLEAIAAELVAEVKNRGDMAAQRRYSVRSAFAMIALELTRPEMTAYRDFYLHAAGLTV